MEILGTYTPSIMAHGRHIMKVIKRITQPLKPQLAGCGLPPQVVSS